MMRSLSLLAGLALFPLAMQLNGNAMMIIDAPSLMIVLLGAYMFTVAAHGGGALARALGAGLSDESMTFDSCMQHRRVLESLRNALCASGAAGFLLGLVAILANLADPSAIGPAVAVAMLTMLYAIILAELVIAPMSNALPARIKDTSSADSDSDLMLTKSRGVATISIVLISQTIVGIGIATAL